MLSALRADRISLMGMLADAEGAQELACWPSLCQEQVYTVIYVFWIIM